MKFSTPFHISYFPSLYLWGIGVRWLVIFQDVLYLRVLDLTLSWICPGFDIFVTFQSFTENRHDPFVVEGAQVK